MKSRYVLLALIGIAVIVSIGSAILSGSFFTVKNIVIETQSLSEDETKAVMELAQIEKGQSILGIDTEKITETINASGTYSVTSISVLYPSTVRIVAEKRVPHSLIETEFGYIIIDKECNVISSVVSAEGYNLPIFTGVRMSQYAYGIPVETKDDYQRNLMLTVMDSLYSLSTVQFVSVISLADPSNMYLISTTGKRLDLHEAADVSAKLSHLASQELQALLTSEEELTITLYKNIFVIS